MKKTVLAMCLSLLSAVLAAAPVDEARAREAARQWLASQPHISRSVGNAPLLKAATPRAYVFATQEAFVLVASDDDDPTVLGYGTYAESDTLPAPLHALLSLKPSARNYPPRDAQWQVVGPLLTTVRHQKSPYNNACPFYTYEDGTRSETRCVVGCVATAMEQVLTYYRREYVLADTLHGWKSSHYEIEDIPPGATVDSRLILDNYDNAQASDESADAVARLSYYLGVAAHMQWGVDESGAYSSALQEPLTRAFGFPYVNYLDSYKYDPSAFWNYLAGEICAGRPIYYAGSIMRGGGHAFVLDGLDSDGLFHVNWGYGGEYDGYYRLDVLAHTQPEADRKDNFTEAGFFCNQEAITLCPDPVDDAAAPDTLSRTGHEFVIEKATLVQQPVTGCATRVELVVRNTSERDLTTPFALLQGDPADTSLVAQADFVAYTGRTLAAGQRDTLLVDACFTRAGVSELRVTPDGEQVIFSQAVNVGEGGTKIIDTDPPVISCTNATTAVVTQTFRNSSATDRAAQFFEYDVLDNLTQVSRSIIHYIYLGPLEDTSEQVTLNGLSPGHSYTFRLRRRWPIVQTADFTTPAQEGIAQPAAESGKPVWYSISGVRVARPSAPGVYLKRQNGSTQKIILDKTLP